MVLALKVNDKDNVATIFAEQVQGGDAIQVRDKKGETIEVKALEAVPYGHKIALQDIVKGADYCKIRRRDRNGFR